MKLSGKARAILAVVVVAGVWVTGRELLSGRTASGARANPRAFSSAKQCRECHPRVFDEWRASHHALADTNPEVLKLSEDFKQKECIACHRPRPIFEVGLGMRPLPRGTRPGDGVDCLTCHADAQGRILGSRNLPDAGCTPIRSEDFVSFELCRSCHDQHQTTEQWEKSAWAREGVTCNDCHMAQADRPGRSGDGRAVEGPGPKGRSHVFPGCHDLVFLERAAQLRVMREGDRVVVEVENTGAGHNFPTEERHRAVDIVYRFLPAGEAGEADAPFTRLYRFRQPYLDEPDENTQLAARTRWTGGIDVGGAKAGRKLEVRMLYKLQPFLSDAQAQVLATRVLEL